LIKHGLCSELVLGNLSACRDWGHARDYVRAMWLMLQQDEPSDYVIATGVEHSVQDFCEQAFAHVNLDWQDYVRCDKSFERPADVESLCGESSKAREKFAWRPEFSFEDLVTIMVEKDMERVGKNPQGVEQPGFWYL